MVQCKVKIEQALSIQRHSTRGTSVLRQPGISKNLSLSYVSAPMPSRPAPMAPRATWWSADTFAAFAVNLRSADLFAGNATADAQRADS